MMLGDHFFRCIKTMRCVENRGRCDLDIGCTPDQLRERAKRTNFNHPKLDSDQFRGQERRYTA